MRILAWCVVASCLVGGLSAAAEPSRPAIGSTIGELKFKDIRSLPRTLTEVGPARAYVLLFTTTECPIVRRVIPRVVELERQFRDQQVQFVAVNVGANDSIRLAAAQAIDFEAPFPFVKDVDLSCAAALGVERTPTAVVLDGERKLVYRGRVDDQHRLGGARPRASRSDLAEAIREVLQGKAVSVAETPVDGCLITEPVDFQADAPPPTFHKDIAPILYKRCASCHREGTAAPFSLLTYDDAAAHAEMLVEVVVDGRMPPWSAHPKIGKFQNDPSLTKEETSLLTRWVKTGRKAGDPADAPASPEPPQSEWRIGEPDRIITTVENFEIQATGYVDYIYTVLPVVFVEDTWIEAVEVKPDNPRVVHHCNMAYLTQDGGGDRTFITGHVPGGPPLDSATLDNGTAMRLPRFSTLGLEIHFTPTGQEERCRISVGLRFPKRTVHKELRHFLLDPRKLAIPPGDGGYAVHSGRKIDRDSTLLGLFAHMHLRGKDATFYARLPDKSRKTLLQIPTYNFDWQLGYEIAPDLVKLPAGTRIESTVHFDNSKFNPYNPDPTRTVPWGMQTFDEMFNGFGFYVHDDEDLNLEVDPANGQVVKKVGG